MRNIFRMSNLNESYFNTVVLKTRDNLPFFWVLFYSPFLFPRRVESSVLLFFSQQIVSFVSSSAKYKNKHVSLTSIISNGGGRPRWDGQSTSYKQTHVVYQESFLNAFESFLYNGKDLTWRFLSLMDGKLTANPSGRTKVGRWGTKTILKVFSFFNKGLF